MDDIGEGNIFDDLRVALAQVAQCLEVLESKFAELSTVKGIGDDGE